MEGLLLQKPRAPGVRYAFESRTFAYRHLEPARLSTLSTTLSKVVRYLLMSKPTRGRMLTGDWLSPVVLGTFKTTERCEGSRPS